MNNAGATATAAWFRRDIIWMLLGQGMDDDSMIISTV
jgi:hypothetical protein